LLYYQKEIAYIDYYESNEKIKNIGFVKLNQKNDTYQIKIVIKGLLSTDTFQCKIKDAQNENSWGEIKIINGCGELEKEMNEKEMVSGFLFQISPNRYGKVRWKLGQELERVRPLETKRFNEEKKTKKIKRLKNLGKETQYTKGYYEGETNDSLKLKGKTLELDKAQDSYKTLELDKAQDSYKTRELDKAQDSYKTQEPDQALKLKKETFKKENNNSESGETSRIESDRCPHKFSEKCERPFRRESANIQKNVTEQKREENYRIKEESKSEKEEKRKEFGFKEKEDSKIIGDKWQQLCDTLEKVYPFENKEMGTYLSIEPKDFVILPSKHHSLVNNSFLLHGFYNYKSLILGKMEKENEIRYYLGVPGNYYEREKMVAIMFGFEAFEGALKEEVKTGTFGYYLCRVEL